jgi:hypothetical protein
MMHGFDAIVLPDGRKLVTLLDAATYAAKLPKKEAGSAEWQAAIESLMLVAELDGPTMFGRIGIMKALPGVTFGSLTHLARNPTGDAGSWREIDKPLSDQTTNTEAANCGGLTRPGLVRF